MDNCNPTFNLVELGAKLSSVDFPKNDKEKEPMQHIPYQQAIGSLMWAMVYTRPDLAYVVGQVAKFMSNPSPTHWTIVQQIFKYLKGTLSKEITYKKYKELLFGFSNTDCGGDLDSRHSTGGYYFTFAKATISWSSKHQNSVSLSSIEAEYMALSKATTKAIWLQRLLNDVRFPQKIVNIYYDSNSGIGLTTPTKQHERTKHIDIRYHYIREKVIEGLIFVLPCSTNDNIVDIFTKGLTRDIHEKFTLGLGVVNKT